MDRIPEPMDADMRAFTRWMGSASDGAHVLEPPGVLAAVVPAVPERSVLNAVVYEDVAALRDALPELAHAYDGAGVAAWTVWVPEGDREVAELLARAGHVLDAGPAAMVCSLDELDAPDIGDLDWTGEGDLAELAAVNDKAYGYAGSPFSTALGRSHEAARVYIARRDGRAACALATLELDGSAGVCWVATVPEARGAGMASRLLGRALADARERGCTTATLQATKMGAPLYERLGFRGVGVLQMWERRRG